MDLSEEPRPDIGIAAYRGEREPNHRVNEDTVSAVDGQELRSGVDHFWDGDDMTDESEFLVQISSQDPVEKSREVSFARPCR